MMETAALCNMALTGLTVAMFASGMPTVMAMIRKGTCQDVPHVPWCAQLANCFVWSKYGIMKDSLTIIVSNMVGAAITVFYLSVMWRLHSNQAVLVVPYMLTMGVVTGLLGYIQYGVEDYDVALYRLGMIGSSMGIVMFASPLLAVRQVIRTASTSSLLFSQSLMFFVCSASWTVFGTYYKDKYVQVPNMIGATFAALQLVLFCIYPARKSRASLAPQTTAKRSQQL